MVVIVVVLLLRGCVDVDRVFLRGMALCIACNWVNGGVCSTVCNLPPGPVLVHPCSRGKSAAASSGGPSFLLWPGLLLAFQDKVFISINVCKGHLLARTV